MLEIAVCKGQSPLFMTVFTIRRLSLPGRSVWKGYSPAYVHSLLQEERALFNRHNSLCASPTLTGYVEEIDTREDPLTVPEWQEPDDSGTKNK